MILGVVALSYKKLLPAVSIPVSLSPSIVEVHLGDEEANGTCTVGQDGGGLAFSTAPATHKKTSSQQGSSRAAATSSWQSTPRTAEAHEHSVSKSQASSTSTARCTLPTNLKATEPFSGPQGHILRVKNPRSRPSELPQIHQERQPRLLHNLLGLPAISQALAEALAHPRGVSARRLKRFRRTICDSVTRFTRSALMRKRLLHNRMDRAGSAAVNWGWHMVLARIDHVSGST